MRTTHPTVIELQRGCHHRVWILEIAGLTHRYISHEGVPSRGVPGLDGSGISYTDVLAITHVGEEEWSVDPIGGIVTHRPIAITLGSAGRRARSETDPSRTFGRVGAKAASWSAVITETIDQELSTGVIKLSEDPTTLDLPRLLHVGAETFWAPSGHGSSPDPSDPDPYRIHFAVRGVANTRPQRHAVETYLGAQTSDQPLVTAEIVAWRTRRAILYVAAGRADGSVSEPIEYMRGVIDRTPEWSEGGCSVNIDLVPYTGLLDVEVPALGSPTELVDDYHYFTAGRASTLSYQVDFGPTLLVSTGTDGAAAPAELVPVGSTTEHEALFDIDLPNQHPRRGTMKPWASQTRVLPTGYVGGFQVDPLPADIPAGSLDSLPVGEVHEFTLAPTGRADKTVLAWPDVLRAESAAWRPGTTQGLGGAWADVRVWHDDAADHAAGGGAATMAGLATRSCLGRRCRGQLLARRDGGRSDPAA